MGGVAQLAEHRVCNAGVRGSNPLTSTRLCDLKSGVSDLRISRNLSVQFGIALSAGLKVEVSTPGRKY